MPRAAAAERVSEVEKLVNKRYPGALRRASDPSLQIVKLPTGILSLDVCLDGGLARGRHHEIYGLNHVGKTYITFRLIAETQRAGGKCAFVDVENTFDPRFAAHAGVKLDELDMPEHGLYGDDLINIMELLIYSREYSVIVLDSIASLLPKAEAEKALGEGTYGTQQARLMSSAMRKLTTANRDVCLVYINQMRENIGVMFGKKYTPTGGKAMSFYAGTRLELSRVEQIKRKRRRVDSKGEERIVDVLRGHRVLVKVEKDKMQPVSEPVLTPSGWVPIGSLNEGDEVIGSDGQPTKVVGVYPQLDRRVLRVGFNDGSWTRCGPEHLWTVRSDNRTYTVTTEALQVRLARNPRVNIKVPLLASPANIGGPSLPIHPYLLGALLGDGCFGKESVRFSNADDEIIRGIRSALPIGMRIAKEVGDNYDYRLVGAGNPLLDALRSLGLAEHRAHEKFVPEQYLRADPVSRLALLQGLMDTDGWVDAVNGSCGLSCTSKSLVDAVREIVWLAGGTSTYRQQHFARHRTAHKTNLTLPEGISPFRLQRKVEGLRQRTKYPPVRLVKSVTVEPDEDSLCIRVANADGLYLTRHSLLTHNTGGAMVGDETTFVYDYDLGGVDPVEDLLYLGRSFGLIHKSGTRWWVEGFEEEAQQGRSKMHRWLRRNVAVAEELEGLIRTAASEPRAVGEMDASEGDEGA